MDSSLLMICAIVAAVGAAISALGVLRLQRIRSAPSMEDFGQLLRGEADRIKQSDDDRGRALRQEIVDGLRGFQDSTVTVFRELGDALSGSIRSSTERLDSGVKAIRDDASALGARIDQDMTRMNEQAVEGRDTLRRTIEVKIDDAATRHATAAKDLRDELNGGFERLGSTIADTLTQAAARQREGLDQVGVALGAFSDKQEKAQEGLRQTVESRLEAIRAENAGKLDEMRRTVDDRLQSTLETRLGESFNRVVEQLERVHKGIGEMQTLATGVGDLKKVLSNVRARGAFGEVQLGALLEQFLSPEQYCRNVQVQEHSLERVEFAIRLPGRGESEVLLPVDAKFPLDDYERLVDALQAGDADLATAAANALEARVRSFAKAISEKYIATPRTTDFAILFLPTESLYAEVLRSPGLLDSLQREYHVTLAGPTTFAALLNGLQMGFRSLAIEKRSSEVWQILGAVRSEFGKYNGVVTRLARQLDTAAKSVQVLGVRTRAMDRKLGDVEKLPAGAGHALLGIDQPIIDDEEPDVSPEISAPEIVIPEPMQQATI
jgi:DNA recombination protein RmuC